MGNNLHNIRDKNKKQGTNNPPNLLFSINNKGVCLHLECCRVDIQEIGNCLWEEVWVESATLSSEIFTVHLHSK